MKTATETHYEIYTCTGLSDVVTADTYEKALKSAQEWADETGKQIAIVRIDETLVRVVGGSRA